MQNKIILLILAFIAITSCKPPVENPSRIQFTQYLLKAGEHESVPRVFGLYTKNELEFDAKFDETAVYEIDPVQQESLNKLLGFSDCSKLHHEDSARFVWRYVRKKLEVHAYIYVNSVRKSQFLATVEINEEAHYKLSIVGGTYHFEMRTKAGAFNVDMERGCESTTIAKYWLGPYFGGEAVSPHDISIWIKQ